MRRLPCIAAVLLLLAGAGSAIAQKAPDPADLLFDTPQWRTATAGSEIVYRYRRASPLEDVFGSSMDDRIRLDLEAGASDTSRTVRVQMFSEGRRKPAGPFEDVEGNPVIVLFLEHHLANLAHVLKANPRYLKNAIRAGLREKAVMTPATATIRDEPVPVMRIETRPFLEDPNKDRMRGLESLTYTFTISDQVPGTILSIEAHATAADGAELLRESVTYDETAH